MHAPRVCRIVILKIFPQHLGTAPFSFSRLPLLPSVPEYPDILHDKLRISKRREGYRRITAVDSRNEDYRPLAKRNAAATRRIDNWRRRRALPHARHEVPNAFNPWRPNLTGVRISIEMATSAIWRRSSISANQDNHFSYLIEQPFLLAIYILSTSLVKLFKTKMKTSYTDRASMTILLCNCLACPITYIMRIISFDYL